MSLIVNYSFVVVEILSILTPITWTIWMTLILISSIIALTADNKYKDIDI